MCHVGRDYKDAGLYEEERRAQMENRRASTGRPKLATQTWLAVTEADSANQILVQAALKQETVWKNYVVKLFLTANS